MIRALEVQIAGAFTLVGAGGFERFSSLIKDYNEQRPCVPWKTGPSNGEGFLEA